MAVNSAAVTAASFMQWQLGAGTRGDVLPKSSFKGPAERNYYLKNSNVRKFLQWEEQHWGINIGWTDDASPETAKRVARWFVARRDGGDKPIKYGEPVSIGYGTEPSFLNYDRRDAGINLRWTKTPSFEWQFLGGKLGSAVRTGQWFALWNDRSEVGGEPLMYFDRSAGGDIGWPTSKTFGEQVREAAIREARKAAMEYLKSQTGGDASAPQAGGEATGPR